MEIALRRLIGHRVIVMGRSVSRQGLRSANSYSRCSLSPMGYVDGECLAEVEYRGRPINHLWRLPLIGKTSLRSHPAGQATIVELDGEGYGRFRHRRSSLPLQL
jgi:hypothetical protein